MHTLAAHVAGYGGVVALASNFVNFVDEDNAALGLLYIVVGLLQQAGQDAFDVLAHVASLREHSGVHNGEGHIEQFGNGSSQKGLACASVAHKYHVRFLYLYIVIGSVGLPTWQGVLHQTFVVVVDCHR